jgi:DNA-binding NarL/FixJ family response regulator
MSGAPLRIVVVDDHPVFRMGLTALLASLDGLEVAGEADSIATAIAAVESLEPDVVIMDLHLGDESGVEATREVIARRPGVGVLVVTMVEEEDTVFAAIRAGARGYLLKGAGRVEIERAVRAVAAGEMLLAPEVAARTLPLLVGGGRRSAPVAFPTLTEREHEVLELVARGLDNVRVARRLGLSDKTVRNHLSNILTKLAVTDRAAAIAKARDAGMGVES